MQAGRQPTILNASAARSVCHLLLVTAYCLGQPLNGFAPGWLQDQATGRLIHFSDDSQDRSTRGVKPQDAELQPTAAPASVGASSLGFLPHDQAPQDSAAPLSVQPPLMVHGAAGQDLRLVRDGATCAWRQDLALSDAWCALSRDAMQPTIYVGLTGMQELSPRVPSH